MEMRHAEPVTFSSRWRCCCRVDKGIFIVVIVELFGGDVGCSGANFVRFCDARLKAEKAFSKR